MQFRIFFVLLLTISGTHAQWVAQSFPNKLNALRFVHFTSANIGFAGGDGDSIYKTIDGGINWIPSALGSLSAITFTNANTAYAVGTYQSPDTVQSYPNSAFFKSTNGGLTWTRHITTFNWTLNSVFFVDSNTGYAVSTGGQIYKTTDAGNIWNLLNSSPNSGDLASVFFPSPNIGYIVGSGGVLKTMDAGSTWKTQTVSATTNLRSVYFANDSLGWAVGSKGTILKTTNGGKNWISRVSGTTYQLNRVYFTDANTGYVVGGGVALEEIVLKTFNSGDSWNTQTSPGINGMNWGLTSVYFQNADTGYAVGYRSIFLKTTNGGGAYTPVPLFSRDQNPKSFLLKKNGDLLYNLSSGSHIQALIFDASGRTILNLVNENQDAGEHVVDLSRLNLAHGPCFLNFKTDKIQKVVPLLAK